MGLAAIMLFAQAPSWTRVFELWAIHQCPTEHAPAVPQYCSCLFLCLSSVQHRGCSLPVSHCECSMPIPVLMTTTLPPFCCALCAGSESSDDYDDEESLPNKLIIMTSKVRQICKQVNLFCLDCAVLYVHHERVRERVE
jgi:hypothetical protein